MSGVLWNHWIMDTMQLWSISHVNTALNYAIALLINSYRPAQISGCSERSKARCVGKRSFIEMLHSAAKKSYQRKGINDKMYADCTISVEDILTEGVKEGFGYRETLYIKMQ